MGEPRCRSWKVCGAALAAFLSTEGEAVGGSGLAALAERGPESQLSCPQQRML